MAGTHGPVVSGVFYPDDAAELGRLVRRQLDSATTSRLHGALGGLIVPHAALVYSGPVAAMAYGLLVDRSIERVVMIGPAHFARFDGIAALPAATWRTPLGEVRLELPVTNGLVAPTAEPYRREHCLEVQLPFLQMMLREVPIVPLLFGDVDPDAGGDFLDRLLGSGDLLVVSSDLSHYLPDEDARTTDAATADSIVALDPGGLGPGAACGRVCIQATLVLARIRGWEIELLQLATSADTSGSRDRVVGYGAFAMVVTV